MSDRLTHSDVFGGILTNSEIHSFGGEHTGTRIAYFGEPIDRLFEIENLLYDKIGNEVINLDRLRELASADRDGRVVVLPCKNGTVAYKLWYTPCHKGATMPDDARCLGCEDDCDSKRAVVPFVFSSAEHILSMIGSLGKFWFLTEPAAAAALASKSGAGEGAE